MSTRPPPLDHLERLLKHTNIPPVGLAVNNPENNFFLNNLELFSDTHLLSHVAIFLKEGGQVFRLHYIEAGKGALSM